jgi:hypothetical protein
MGFEPLALFHLNALKDGIRNAKLESASMIWLDILKISSSVLTCLNFVVSNLPFDYQLVTCPPRKHVCCWPIQNNRHKGISPCSQSPKQKMIRKDLLIKNDMLIWSATK